jgi:hypothetical protein
MMGWLVVYVSHSLGLSQKRIIFCPQSLLKLLPGVEFKAGAWGEH